MKTKKIYLKTGQIPFFIRSMLKLYFLATEMHNLIKLPDELDDNLKYWEWDSLLWERYRGFAEYIHRVAQSVDGDDIILWMCPACHGYSATKPGEDPVCQYEGETVDWSEVLEIVFDKEQADGILVGYDLSIYDSRDN